MIDFTQGLYQGTAHKNLKLSGEKWITKERRKNVENMGQWDNKQVIFYKFENYKW